MQPSISKNIHFPATFQHYCQRMPRAVSCSLSPSPPPTPLQWSCCQLLLVQDSAHMQQSLGLGAECSFWPVQDAKQCLPYPAFRKGPSLFSYSRKRARGDDGWPEGVWVETPSPAELNSDPTKRGRFCIEEVFYLLWLGDLHNNGLWPQTPSLNEPFLPPGSHSTFSDFSWHSFLSTSCLIKYDISLSNVLRIWNTASQSLHRFIKCPWHQIPPAATGPREDPNEVNEERVICKCLLVCRIIGQMKTLS